MENKIVITTGKKTYKIEDENGNYLGDISFNASDVNLLGRLYDLGSDIAEQLKKCEKVKNDNAYALMVEIDTAVKKSIDNVFGEGTSHMIFGDQSIYSETDGVSLLERFMTTIIPVIKSDLEAGVAAKKARMKSYTDQVVE